MSEPPAVRILYCRMVGDVMHGRPFRVGAWSYPQHAAKIAQILTVLHHLVSDPVTTVRHLYYRDVALFRHQPAAQAAVAFLTAHLQVSPFQLGVYPTQKSLVYGPVFAEPCPAEPYLIPDSWAHRLDSHSAPALAPFDAVVVFEKDAVFKSFVDHLRARRITRLLVLTGKGFPDHTTRRLICHLSAHSKKPIWAFVDCDVYGSAIAYSYKTYGGYNRLESLGVYLHQCSSGVVAISWREFKLLGNFLAKTAAQHPHWARETQRRLVLFKKAEMDSLQPEWFLSAVLNKLT